jgi:hypothetical protein
MDPEEIRDMVITYIKEEHEDSSEYIVSQSWTGGRATASEIVGHEVYVYTSDGWEVTIEWNVVAPEYLVYRIVAQHDSGIVWRGEVRSGQVLEAYYSPAREIEALGVSELLMNPIFDQDVSVFGKISLLGELFCSCFELTSDGETILVWYVHMDEVGNESKNVSVDIFDDGDWVIVTGQLQEKKSGRDLHNFWLDTIVVSTSKGEPLTEQMSLELSRNYVLNSPTFLFDGEVNSLSYVETRYLRCPYCWQFVFSFNSLHSGYGDRNGQALAEVITPHEAVITMIKGKISQGVLDDRWDMMAQRFI